MVGLVVYVATAGTVAEFFPALGLIQIWQPFVSPVNGSEQFFQV